MDLSSTLDQIFQRTLSLLPELEAQRMKRQFAKDWTADDLHFFPMWMKENNQNTAVIQVADYEYLKFSLSREDFSKSSQPGWHLHPSTRWVVFDKGADALSLKPGIYALWKSKNQVHEKILDKEELMLLEALQDDQVFLASAWPEHQLILKSLQELGLVEFRQI